MTWVELSGHATAQGGRPLPGGSIAAVVNGKRVLLSAGEACGRAVARLATTICGENQLSAAAALRHASELSIGGIIVDRGHVVLRHTLLLDTTTWDQVVALIVHLASEARRLAPPPVTGGANPMSVYAD